MKRADDDLPAVSVATTRRGGHRVVPDGAIALNAGMWTPGGIEASGAIAAGAEGTAGALNDMIVAVGAVRDRAAFARLFGHFAPRIKSYLMRLGCEAGSAEELMQEVMVTVWRRAETFDPAQASASTWVFAIARNKRIDAVRRERRPELDPEDPALMPEPAASADAAVESAQTVDRVRAAMQTLPEEQRVLLRMAYYDDKPHSLIAQECGLPLGTVKSRIRLAVGRLRKVLKDS